MNAEQHHHPLPVENAAANAQSPGSDSTLSALVDGELAASEYDTLLNSLESDALSNWHAYQVIGDVLRGHDNPTGNRPAVDFLAAVRIGLEERHTDPNATLRPVIGTPVSVPQQARRGAANDAVFRWKLVAGFASLAAVMAVSWSVVAGPGSMGATSAQLALGAPATEAAVESPVVSAPVAVNTGQGVLIRDAQLEALLAEHRQHGGMSALQMPSGFIRNATYEAAAR